MSMLDALREQRSALAAEVDALLDGDASAEAVDAVEDREGQIKALDERIAKIESAQQRSAEIAESRAAAGIGSAGMFSLQ